MLTLDHTAEVVPGDEVASTATPKGATASAYEQLLRHNSSSTTAANDSGAPGLDEGEADHAQAPHLSSDRALTVNIIGPRIVAARALNGITQTDLAKMLGYVGPAHTSQVEAGRRAPSLSFIVRACQALAVSSDWLLGLSDEPDFDPKLARRAALQRSVRHQLDAVVDVLTDAFEQHHAHENPVCVVQLVDSAAIVVDSFTKFQAANEDAFVDMPAGAMLVHATKHLGDHVQAARASLKRHREFDAELRVALGAVKVKGQNSIQIVRAT